MSAQPTIAPTTRPRWTPVVVAAPIGDAGPDVDVAAASGSPSAVAAPISGPRGGVVRLAPSSRASAWRRRLAVAVVTAITAIALTMLVGGGTAGADLDAPTAGTATVAPGETLWDVAADTAPSGMDPREQLSRIVELNGFDGTAVDAWTVVLLPAA